MVMCSRSVLPLSQLEVLVIDCQATAAAPRGHLLEIGWARARTTITHAQVRLIALSDGQHIPPAVCANDRNLRGRDAGRRCRPGCLARAGGRRREAHASA